MSVIAVSESLGSLGIEIGREVAARLGYEFAERDIISKAADRYGADLSRLSHAAEERPTLLERFTAEQHRFAHYVDATVHEMAARDNFVIVGLASTLILANAPHTLRVRVTASEPARAGRLSRQLSLPPDLALRRVRESDRERAGRVRFLYHVHWEDPLLYDFVMNTEKMESEEGARLLQQMLEHERFRSTEESRRTMKDRSLVAQAYAVLMADPVTRERRLTVTSEDAVLSVGGRVEEWSVRRAVQQALSSITGVREIRFLTPAAIDGEGGGDAGGDLYGASRRWGGYGPSA
ncbi:MAG TPA: cytidylate kinase-like family protein [Methylomirabilota bacterium]|nr:cytidylate kinase-like family protein [Methylomirabilota bacterium]